MSFNPNSNVSQIDAVNAVQDCIRNISEDLGDTDTFKLNDDNTEIILIGTWPELDKMNTSHLGSWFDSNLSMTTQSHINKIL